MPITALPQAPSRADPANFVARADAFLGALDVFRSQANALANEVNQNALSASTAQAARDVALAAANYRGLWSSLSGPISIPASVYYADSFWVLTSNLANVQAEVPGAGGVWQPASGLRSNMPTTKPSLNCDFAADKRLHSGFDFGRASVATYFNDEGVLVSAPADVPRIDYDPVTRKCLGLLMEETRVNVALDSRACDTANGLWAASPNISRVGKTVGPDGTNNATVYTTVTAGNAFVNQLVALEASTVYTYSIYAKLVSGSVPTQGSLLLVDYDTDNNPGTPDRIGLGFSGLTAEWKLFQLTFTNRAAVVGSIYLATDFANGAHIAFSEAQLEIGYGATSRIRTTSAAAVRAGDTALLQSTKFQRVFNPLEGTLVLTGSALYSTAPVAVVGLARLDDGTFDNNIAVRYYTGDNLVRFDATSALNGVAQADFAEAAYAVGQEVTQAIAYAPNDFAFSRNGSAVESNSAALIPSALSFLRLGDTPYTGASHIKRLCYYAKRLSNPELQAISAQ